jgi:hypothetical protein
LPLKPGFERKPFIRDRLETMPVPHNKRNVRKRQGCRLLRETVRFAHEPES